jgi:hypothetical protein
MAEWPWPTCVIHVSVRIKVPLRITALVWARAAGADNATFGRAATGEGFGAQKKTAHAAPPTRNRSIGISVLALPKQGEFAEDRHRERPRRSV